MPSANVLLRHTGKLRGVFCKNPAKDAYEKLAGAQGQGDEQSNHSVGQVDAPGAKPSGKAACAVEGLTPLKPLGWKPSKRLTQSKRVAR